MTPRSQTADAGISLASSVAPEDLHLGDFVAILDEIIEFPSFLWDQSSSSNSDNLVRVQFSPEYPGAPLKVRAICLPFLYVKSASGNTFSLDVRRLRLVRLKTKYAKRIWRDFRKARADRKNRRK